MLSHKYDGEQSFLTSPIFKKERTNLCKAFQQKYQKYNNKAVLNYACREISD